MQQYLLSSALSTIIIISLNNDHLSHSAPQSSSRTTTLISTTILFGLSISNLPLSTLPTLLSLLPTVLSSISSTSPVTSLSIQSNSNISTPTTSCYLLSLKYTTS